MAYVKVLYDRRKENKGREPAADPSLAVAVDGGITLNTTALARLGNPSKVVLLWDADVRRLGVRADEDSIHSYAVHHPNGKSCGQIHPRSFWTRLRIKPTRSLLRAEFDEATGILSAPLPATQDTNTPSSAVQP